MPCRSLLSVDSRPASTRHMMTRSIPQGCRLEVLQCKACRRLGDIYPDVQVRMMSQISNAVEVTVLPPYVPSEEERASPALYAQNVQALFCKTLGVPAVDQVWRPPRPIFQYPTVNLRSYWTLCGVQ